MTNLIKSDLYRYFKSKHFLVICIVAGVLAVLTPLLNFLLGLVVAKLDNEILIEEIRYSSSSLASMQNSFNPSSLFGFLLPIFVAIILASEFKDGTIRNKIICGYAKEKIHLSNMLSTFIFIATVMLGYGIVTFIVSVMFFNPVPAGVAVGGYIGNMFLSVLFDVLSYIFVASVVLLLVMLIRTQGLSAFIYIVLIFGFQLIGTVIASIINVIDTYETNMEGIITFLNVLNWINPFYLMGTIVIADYPTSLIVSNIITPIIWAGINCYLAYLLLKKKDIK